ncbi:hypothetical protein [Endozoicomonas lisbonensis]
MDEVRHNGGLDVLDKMIQVLVQGEISAPDARNLEIKLGDNVVVLAKNSLDGRMAVSVPSKQANEERDKRKKKKGKGKKDQKGQRRQVPDRDHWIVTAFEEHKSYHEKLMPKAIEKWKKAGSPQASEFIYESSSEVSADEAGGRLSLHGNTGQADVFSCSTHSGFPWASEDFLTQHGSGTTQILGEINKNYKFNSLGSARLTPEIVFDEAGFTERRLNSIMESLTSDDEHLLFETESIDVLDAAYNPGELLTDQMILDAVTSRYGNGFTRTVRALARVLSRQSDKLEVMEPIIGKPRRAGGFATVTAQIPISDGQTVSIVFHAPDSAGRIQSGDFLIAYRWLLNKRDVTHVVAPEMTQRGVMKDIPLATVGRRVMQLVHRNSARFVAQSEQVAQQRKAVQESELLIEQLSERSNKLQSEIDILEEDAHEYQAKADQMRLDLASLENRNRALANLRPRGSNTRNIRAQDMEIETRLEVVAIDQLITSDQDNFDQSLQPRDRTRESSKEQIRSIIRNFDPNQLLDAPTADTGAPIVSHDNLVESGNGRTMAMREIVKDELLHRRYAKAVKEATGLDLKAGEMLIRRRTTDLSEDDRILFTKKANQMTVSKMSATEQGLSDARMIDEAMLSDFKGGDITATANNQFVRSFIGKLPVNEHGDLLDAHGGLSQSGVARIRNALLGAAYGSPSVMSRITESTDDNVKSISGALVDAAPAIAQLKRDVEAGRVKADFDISTQIAEAAGKVSQARQNRTAISELLSQADMLSAPDPVTDELIKLFHNPELTRAIGRDKIAVSLITYADQARRETVDDTLFGDDFDISPEQILQDINQRREAAANQSSLFDCATQFWLNPYFDGMRLTSQATTDDEFSPLQVDAAMSWLEEGKGAEWLQQPTTVDVLDSAYNPGKAETDSFILDSVAGEGGNRLAEIVKQAFNLNLPENRQIVDKPVIGTPRRSGGFSNVTVQLPLADGQTISTVLHVPDNTGRVHTGDQPVAYRWMLNQRDVTQTVAPVAELQGEMRDMPLQTVGRRMAQLVQANGERLAA